MKCTRTIIVLCWLVIFAACKKSDNNNDNSNTTAPTRRQLLLAGKWQIIANTETVTYMGKDTTRDAYSLMEECKKDNFDLFADNGTMIEDENTNICTGHTQTAAGEWALLNNDTRLAIIDKNPDTAEVVEITATQMKIKFIGTNTAGDLLVDAYTFKNIK